MANLESALQQLREERKEAEKQIERLDAAIRAIASVVGRSNSTEPVQTRHRGRVLSAASRRRMAQAQKGRWAKAREGPNSKAKSVPQAKRVMSPASRRKIAAAQRARWAKVKPRSTTQQKRAA